MRENLPNVCVFMFIALIGSCSLIQPNIDLESSTKVSKSLRCTHMNKYMYMKTHARICVTPRNAACKINRKRVDTSLSQIKRREEAEGLRISLGSRLV